MNFTHFFFLLLAALVSVTLAASPKVDDKATPKGSEPSAAAEPTGDKKAVEKKAEATIRMTSVTCDTAIKVPVTEFVAALIKEKVNLMDYTKCTKDQVAELEKALTGVKFTVAKTEASVTSIAEELTKLGFTYESAKAQVKDGKIESVVVGNEKVSVHTVITAVPQAEGCPMWYWIVGILFAIVLIGGIAFVVLRK
jgi:hypothetical protein